MLRKVGQRSAKIGKRVLRGIALVPQPVPRFGDLLQADPQSVEGRARCLAISLQRVPFRFDLLQARTQRGKGRLRRCAPFGFAVPLGLQGQRVCAQLIQQRARLVPFRGQSVAQGLEFVRAGAQHGQGDARLFALGHQTLNLRLKGRDAGPRLGQRVLLPVPRRGQAGDQRLLFRRLLGLPGLGFAQPVDQGLPCRQFLFLTALRGLQARDQRLLLCEFVRLRLLGGPQPGQQGLLTVEFSVEIVARGGQRGDPGVPFRQRFGLAVAFCRQAGDLFPGRFEFSRSGVARRCQAVDQRHLRGQLIAALQLRRFEVAQRFGQRGAARLFDAQGIGQLQDLRLQDRQFVLLRRDFLFLFRDGFAQHELDDHEDRQHEGQDQQKPGHCVHEPRPDRGLDAPAAAPAQRHLSAPVRRGPVLA